ncbi:MAG: TRAP transporter substrate-binding protein DctP [Pseudomonadota bacterium]|nr:TRAP transporter substrate-binding protein DctP [Pseudomonadota bacterium]
MSILRSCLVGVAVAGLTATSALAVSLDTVISLKTTHDQSKTYIELFHKPFNKNNKVGINLNFKGGPEVIPNRKQGAALKRGVIKFHFGPSGYYSGAVPCARVAALSNVGQATIRKNGAMEVFQKCFGKGLNARIIAHPFDGSSNFHIYLTNPPKTSTKTGLDLSGMTMRSTALYNPFMKAMGARPQNISPGDVYTSLERGVVKGLAWPEGGIMRYGWTKYIKYRVGPGFWRSSSMVVINLDAYNAMNKKQRDAIDKAGEAFEPASQKYMRVLADKDNAAVKADGVKFIDLTGDEGKALTATVYGKSWDYAKSKMDPENYAQLRKLLLK